MIKWFKIADNEEEIIVAENSIAVIEVNGKKICLTKHGNDWHAFAYKCPHASGIMGDGYIDGLGNVVCPVHRYKFNLKNGRNTSGEGYYLKIYKTEAKDDGIYVGMESWM
jgi:3-phenylpropionate/trans-cinnamate dioxygenase ferredoxin subunit